jgi:hypothetical protein
LGVNESAAVAVSIGIELPVIAIVPLMPAWLVTDLQDPDTYVTPETITRTVTAIVQSLFTKGHLRAVA